MTRDKQRLSDYLEHILEAIDRINRYTEDIDEVAFLEDEMVQDAVIRNFEIIGEASHNIEKHFPEFAASHPELPYPWRSPIRCETLWHMDISQWILKLSGRRFKAIFPAYTGRCGKYFPKVELPTQAPISNRQVYNLPRSIVIHDSGGEFSLINV